MAERAFTAEPGSTEIKTTYVFDAPRERVFEAYNDPKLTAEWWGPAGHPLTVDKLEAETGGSWRFVVDLGDDFCFRGVYHEVTANEQLVFTWQYEGAPIVILQTVTFEELPDGKTKVTDQGIFQSVEARDAMVGNGMGEGSMPAFDRLAKLL
ncbi:Uncharacterized conserved protein YndB, AHSA1/START domain [Actinokineospora alba]|uniref:Uncharacterized conserved protein YndB, AHSA1/START domain n=1 Tax=Actinokineospora alba TaxID=504798 RepID=A0A1H0HBN1_9PSEU|nr:SRPBCC domain-containing protein [Actinokineospora alba]TDP64948.1 uncharacterized protein YndB with AHSA1/START domain [Actinokineospora alba]SDH50051.1 Uncharacterized conserved protein YndB, AHSA1/START domain [Actinokineospora alba]SDO16616.1 Uncharacterized conserved protein YndB, AHSA1/START domain [Actinokineospora alba]